MSDYWEQYPTPTGMQWRQRDPDWNGGQGPDDRFGTEGAEHAGIGNRCTNDQEPPPMEEPGPTAGQVLAQAGMITAAELDRKVFPPLQWHVPGLVPEGFGLLVAPPKAGKSWLVADVGLACAIGGVAFGVIDVSPRPVLYLALEDGERRLQDRHRVLLGRETTKPERMHLIVNATPLTAPAIIAAFLDLHGRERPMVIVDTLVKIRPQRRPGDEPYQFDYLFASGLKALLDGHPGAGLWAVHHARKAMADDFVDAASGTHGLAGAADYLMVLRHPRLSTHGSLLITGRDVPEGEYALVSNQGCGWRLDGETLTDAAAKAQTQHQQGRLGDRSFELLRFFNERGEKGASPAETALATGIDVEQVRVYLTRLVKGGLLIKPERGRYMSAVISVTSVISPGQMTLSESNSSEPSVTSADDLGTQSNTGCYFSPDALTWGNNTNNTSNTTQIYEDDEPDYSGLDER
jgi:hypothetical protein